jgi:4a-hydroxytetrahydrobiopterin dehydratase
LTVRLQTHDAGGITDKDFELARRIEDVVTWLPSATDALDGPPKGWVK